MAHLKYLFLFLTLSFTAVSVSAQKEIESNLKELDKELRYPTSMYNGEMIPFIIMPEVVIYARRTFGTEEDRLRYLRLRYNVLKVLPYAKFAQERYEQLHRDLDVTKNKKKEKQLVKDCEQEIKSMFNKEVKKMSITQGKILIKLIDRQTGASGYELVKELKGNFNAFFYQSVAKVFGHNLKSEYDPNGEDREIENIVIHTSLKKPVYRYN